MDRKTFGLHQTDARRLREIVPLDSVGVTITSPPYWGMKDYGFDAQIGREPSYEEYLSTLQLIFADVFKVTRRSGSLWIVVDTIKKDGRLIPLPFDLASRLAPMGWGLQDVIIWDKTKTLPWSAKGTLRNTFEYILFFSKDSTFKYYIDRIREPVELKRWWVKYPERYNPRGKDPSNIWRFPIPTQGKWSNGFLRHFCPFPSSLVERIIDLTTDRGDVVLDTFSGSGVVLAQAECMDRNPIGFELSKEYVQAYYEKVQPEVKRLWELRVQTKKALENSRRNLTHRIQVLRKLKFPYLAIRAITNYLDVESPSQLGINSVFAISRTEPTPPRKERANRFLYLDIYFVVDEDAFAERINDAFTHVASKAPLSNFGVDARLHVLDRKKFDSISASNDWKKLRLWFYKSSQFNKYVKLMTLATWREESLAPGWNKYFSGGMPPIVSNLRIRQRVTDVVPGQTTLDEPETTGA